MTDPDVVNYRRGVFWPKHHDIDADRLTAALQLMALADHMAKIRREIRRVRADKSDTKSGEIDSLPAETLGDVLWSLLALAAMAGEALMTIKKLMRENASFTQAIRERPAFLAERDLEILNKLNPLDEQLRILTGIRGDLFSHVGHRHSKVFAEMLPKLARERKDHALIMTSGKELIYPAVRQLILNDLIQRLHIMHKKDVRIKLQEVEDVASNVLVLTHGIIELLLKLPDDMAPDMCRHDGTRPAD